MKKIAVLLRGISYREYYHVENYNNPKKIDYNDSYDNYQQFIFNNLKNNNYEIDVFISTYDSDKKQDIIDKYKPVSYRFDSYNKKQKPTKCLAVNIVNVIELMNNYISNNNTSYEFIILTRFDLLFRRNILDIIENNSKILIPWTHRNNEIIDDNLIISNEKFMNCYLECAKMVRDKKIFRMHCVYRSLSNMIGSENIHFMLDKYNEKNVPYHIIQNTIVNVSPSNNIAL